VASCLLKEAEREVSFLRPRSELLWSLASCDVGLYRKIKFVNVSSWKRLAKLHNERGRVEFRCSIREALECLLVGGPCIYWGSHELGLG
jgi:hypothetical protein